MKLLKRLFFAFALIFSVSNVALGQIAVIKDFKIVRGSKGFTFRVTWSNYDCQGQKVDIVGFFYDGRYKLMDLKNNNYCSKEGQVCTSVSYYPRYFSEDDVVSELYIPYEELHLEPGNHPDLGIKIQAYIQGKWIGGQLNIKFFGYNNGPAKPRPNTVIRNNPAPKPQPTTGRVLNDAIYFVTSVWNNDLCLCVSSEHDGHVKIHDNNHCGWIRLSWDEAKNSYRIKPFYGDQVVDIWGGADHAVCGAGMVSWDDYGGDNQRWILEKSPEGGYFIRSKKNPNILIDVPTNRPFIGEDIHLWDFNGGPWQRWNFWEIKDPNQFPH